MNRDDHKALPLIKRLIRDYVWRQRTRLALALLCMVVVAGATAANAWIMQPVLDDIFIRHNQRMLHVLPFAILIIALVSGAANYGQIVLMRYVGQRIVTTMQIDLFRHLLGSDLTLFNNESSGQLISRFTNDIRLIHGAVSNLLVASAKQALTLIFLLGVMLHQNWQLTLLSFAV
ncbi:MAG: hypothetical protein KGJ06_03000, partial [Pseudomonadota bacterium]|nr:hypothetical protein [Pseudomonadota bacterium]